MPKSTDSNASLSQRYTPVLLLLLGYACYLVRFGYGYGASDQDEFIPFVLTLLDNSLFQNDWFVQTQIEAFSVRTIFVWLVRTFTFVLPLKWAVFLIYFLTWSGVVVGLYILAKQLTQSRLVAISSAGVISLLTPFWTLGGNDLLHSMLVPSMVAWALAIWGMLFFVQSRWSLAATLAGIATLFQALVGLQTVLLFSCLAIWSMAAKDKDEHTISSLLKAGGIYIVCAGAALIPLFYQQLTAAPEPLASAFSETPSLFYIMANFRNPHHYLFDSFNKLRLVQFFFLLLVGYVSLLVKEQKDPAFDTSLFKRTLAIIFTICLIAYLGTEVSPILLIAKLQLFKMTIWIKVLMAIGCCGLLVELVPAAFRSKLEYVLFERPWIPLGLVALGLASIFMIQPDRFSQKVYPYSAGHSVEVSLAQWAETNTKKDEVFAIPPSWSAFRSHAKRAIVINHKAFPYRDEDIPVWFSRLTDMAPIKQPERSDLNLLSDLDEKYNSLSPNDLDALSFEYSFDYIIRNTPLPASTPFSVVHSEGGWFVYKVSPQRLAAR